MSHTGGRLHRSTKQKKYQHWMITKRHPSDDVKGKANFYAFYFLLKPTRHKGVTNKVAYSPSEITHLFVLKKRACLCCSDVSGTLKSNAQCGVRLVHG